MRQWILSTFIFLFGFISHAQETDIPPRPIITPENAHSLTQIAQLGRGRIRDIAFSEDEQTLIVASPIGIWEYDMADLSAPPTRIPNMFFNIINFPIGYDKTISIVAISQNQMYSASAGGERIDGTGRYVDTDILLYDVAQDKIMGVLSGHFGGVVKLLFTADGKYLVSLDTQSIFRIWNVLTGEEVAVIREHSYVSGTMPHISPDGREIAIDILDGTIIVWDTLTFSQQVITWDDQVSDGEPIGGMYSLGFSPDGSTFLAFYWFSRENFIQDTHPDIILAYDTTTWQVRHRIDLISFGIYKWHPTNPSIFMTDRNGSLYMWNYESDVYSMYEFSQPFYQFDFFTNNQQIIYLPYTFETLSEIIIADIETREILHTLQHPFNIAGFQLSQDNHTLVVKLEDRTIWLWDTNTWTVRMVVNGYFVEFMPNSQLMWVINNHSFILVDIQTGDVVQTISILEDYNIKYSPDGHLVVYLSRDNHFYITDIQMEIVSDIYPIYNLQTPDDGAMRLPSIQFSPDERFIMISGRGIILIYAIMTDDITQAEIVP